MKKQFEWIDEYRTKGKDMLPFNFRGFMKKHAVDISELKTILSYTTPGIISMLKRGTIKPSGFLLLNTYYHEAEQFLIKPKKVRKRGS